GPHHPVPPAPRADPARHDVTTPTTPDSGAAGGPLLDVRDLVVSFSPRRRRPFAPRAEVRAVDGVSFQLHAGETLGLVGESGCGKSTTARGVLRLVEPAAGSVRLQGRELLGLKAPQLRA